MKQILFSFFLIVTLAACGSPAVQSDEPVAVTPGAPVNSPIPPNNPYIPQTDDMNLTRGNVYLDSAELLTQESFPPQYQLALTGNLPDPCHQLRVQVAAPDASNRIVVDVYSVTNPDTMCIQVLEPFSENVPLSTSRLDAGHYTVFVNGEKIGEFDK